MAAPPAHTVLWIISVWVLQKCGFEFSQLELWLSLFWGILFDFPDKILSWGIALLKEKGIFGSIIFVIRDILCRATGNKKPASELRGKPCVLHSLLGIISSVGSGIILAKFYPSFKWWVPFLFWIITEYWIV